MMRLFLSASILCTSFVYSFAEASDFGSIGLLNTPSARFEEDGSLILRSTIESRYNSYALTYQLTPKLETTFRYTGINQTDLYDRNYEIKYQIFEETQISPGVAIGIRDLVGTGTGRQR